MSDEPRFSVGTTNREAIPYASASFDDEVYDGHARDPYTPLCCCDTPEEAARVVGLLNALWGMAAAAIAETEAEEENLRHELLGDGVMAAVQAQTRLAEARLARALAVRERTHG